MIVVWKIMEIWGFEFDIYFMVVGYYFVYNLGWELLCGLVRIEEYMNYELLFYFVCIVRVMCVVCVGFRSFVKCLYMFV